MELQYNTLTDYGKYNLKQKQTSQPKQAFLIYTEYRYLISLSQPQFSLSSIPPAQLPISLSHLRSDTRAVSETEVCGLGVVGGTEKLGLS